MSRARPLARRFAALLLPCAALLLLLGAPSGRATPAHRGTSASAAAAEVTLPAPLKSALETIVVDDLKRHETFLTSAECAGRDTLQPGLEKARDYLVDHHKKFGLESGHSDGSYLFEYELPAIVFGAEDHLAVMKGQAVDAFLPGVDFVPVRRSGSGTVEGDVVFCGYGIVDAEEGYDDWKGIDVKGKVVALLLHEPRETKKGRPFKGVDWTDHARISHKGRAAAERGAAAVLLFTDPANHDDLSVLKGEHPRYGSLDPKRDCPIPVVHCSGAIGDRLFGPGQLLSWQKAIDAKLAGAPRAVEGARVRLEVKLSGTQAKTHNVIAVKRGSDPLLRDEWIVLGAHYDHIGVDEYGRIFHGADDNGSGTSCLLEIGEALGQQGVEVKRSVLLIHFSGEEHGLLGAAAWCKAPLFPAEKTLAMVNMDMVGRGRPKEIDAAGLAYSADFQALVRKATTLSRARLKVGEGGMQYFKRSDQFEFWRLGIPVLFFMEPEEHPDYHQVTDTMEKIVFGKVAETAKLVTALTWLLGEAERRPRQEGIPP
ncbi:MAG: M28 family peptidase [Planctomycetes bacterium]|nr:M28 family peptidase [Planctomycetota bacterium]